MQSSNPARCALLRRIALMASLLLAIHCSDRKTYTDRKPSADPLRDAGAAPAETADATDSQPSAGATALATLDASVKPAERDAATAPVADAATPPAPSDSGAVAPAPDAATSITTDVDAGPTVPSPNDDARLYATDTLLELAFTLSDQDWDLIRGQGRTLNEIFSYCLDPAFDYSVVPASASIGDQHFAQLGLRKKGFLGSLSAVKPSLHVDVNQYVSDQVLFGAKTLVLNNSRQDASFTHTCMAYQVFSAAGIAAPRCSYAHVTVNAMDLGIYLNVEAIKKPFLKRSFGDDSGNLYEGSGTTDFRSDMLMNFEKKTNTTQPLSDQITQLTDVLARADANMLTDIETLVDMDEFMRFWATEVLVGHWDGYSGDLNNFYVYVHPVSKKLVFIPWGTDTAFEHGHAYLRKEPRPLSVLAWARLPDRLYAVEQSRERFRSTLRTLLNEHWNEAALLAEVDRIALLLGNRASASELDAQRTFIRNRRAELQQELDATAPAWTIAERPTLMCQPERNSVVTGSFRTTWGDLAQYAPSADNLVDVVLDGTRQTFSGVYASAGLDGSGTPTLQVGAPLPDGRLVAARFFLREVPTAPGEVALHGFETYGAIVRGKDENNYAMDGFIGDGKIVFEQASPASGAALSGHFEAKLITLEPALAKEYGKP
jgi:hypothetical protein